MKKIKLIDSTFSHSNALGLSDENRGEHPESFQWDTTPSPAKVKVFTDLRLHEAIDDPAEKKIGLIVESPIVAEKCHKRALTLRGHFDVIYTHNKKLLDTGDPFKFYPLGGSRIKRWAMFPKTELVSIIVGKKKDTFGQRLRHLIAEKFKADAFGEPFTDYLPSKVPALRPYMYSIVVENGIDDYYFSEKLIDCISQGTIPIYWGCPSIGNFFKEEGIIQFNTLRDLRAVFAAISQKDFERRTMARLINFATAHYYRCAEDWLWDEGAFE